MDPKITKLERRSGNLAAVPKSSREPPVALAVRVLEAALAETVGALEATAQEKNWPWERTQDRVRNMHDLIEELIMSANSSRREWRPGQPRFG
jgi:hypothetical protein